MNNIAHDDKFWYILRDVDQQDQHEGWERISYLDQSTALKHGYVIDDIVVYGDKVIHMLNDTKNQHNEKGQSKLPMGRSHY